MTLANIDRFSELFHWQIPKETQLNGDSVQLYCYTTLWCSKWLLSVYYYHQN